MKTQRKFLWALCSLAVGTLLQSATAQPQTNSTLLNVSFGSTTKLGCAATGITTNDYWNGFAFPWQDTASITLLKSDGTASGVGLTLQNGGGYWGNQTGDIMYDSYVYPNGNLGDGVGNLTVTITNLSTGTYDFYLYGHADPGGCGEEDTLFTLSNGTTVFGPVGTVSSAGWNISQGWQEGRQFIVFVGVRVTSGVPVIITGASGLDGQPTSGDCSKATLNGIQIAKVSQLLDVSFGSTTKIGLAATGLTTNDYWNGFSFPWEDTASISLLKSDGAASGVTLTLQNGGGYWGNQTGDIMYDSYVYPNGNLGDGVGALTVIVTNLSAGTYDFYLYGHANPGGCGEENTMFNLTCGATGLGPVGTLSSADWTISEGWQEGRQFVVFAGVRVAAGFPVVITGSAGFNGQAESGDCCKATLNGIQIAKTISR